VIYWTSQFCSFANFALLPIANFALLPILQTVPQVLLRRVVRCGMAVLPKPSSSGFVFLLPWFSDTTACITAGAAAVECAARDGGSAQGVIARSLEGQYRRPLRVAPELRAEGAEQLLLLLLLLELCSCEVSIGKDGRCSMNLE